MRTDFPIELIPLLPLLGAAFNFLIGRKVSRTLVHIVSCGVIFAAAFLALQVVFGQLYPLVGHTPHPELTRNLYQWLHAGDFHVDVGFLLDPLSAVLLLIITIIGFFIHLYSTGYMAHDPDYARYFGYLNLFTGSM